MAKIKREELSGKFLEAFDKIVKLKNSDDAKQREAGLKGEKALEKLLSSKKGEAVKKEVKPKSKPKAKAKPKSKAKPKAKPKAKSKAKPKAKTKTSTTPKVLPFSTRASNLMKKEGLSWADAKAKLSKEIKDEKDKIEAKLKADKKQALNELEKLTKAPEFQKALSQYPKKGGGKKRAIKTTLSNDGKRQALPRGKRVSKNGKTYYEYRDNRSDVNSLPAPKGQYRYKGNTPPYLADGGAIDSLKKDMNSKLDIHSEYYAKGGRLKVYDESYDVPIKTFNSFEKAKNWVLANHKKYDEITIEDAYLDTIVVDKTDTKDDIEFLFSDNMAKGGDLERFRKTRPNDIYFEVIEYEGIGGRVKNPPLSYETTMEIKDKFKNQPKKYIVVENKNNDGFIVYAKSEKDKRKKIKRYKAIQSGLFAKGGRTISIVNDGVTFDKSKYKAVYGDFDNDGTVNIDDANPLDKTKSGQVEQVELRKTFDKLLGVKAELDEIMYDAVETLDEKAPEGADIYARTKTPYSILKKLVEKRMLDPKRGLTDMIGTTIAVDNQKELEQVRDKIDGGLLGKVLDRDDFYKTPNAGYRAYHYIVEYKGVPVEVQLKTKNMKKLHEVSHEAYKNGTLNAKSLDSLSKTFMRADKGDAKAKAEISKLLSDKKLLASKISKGSMAKGGLTDSKYIPSYEIYEVVTKDGKVYENDYSAMEFLSGAYVSDKVVTESDEKDKNQMTLFDKGGKIPKGAIYIKRRDIDFITVGEDEDDKEKVSGKNLFNGFWIDPKKQKTLIAEAKKDGRLGKSKAKVGDKVKLIKGAGSETVFRNFPNGEYEVKKVKKGNKVVPEGFYEIENKDGNRTQLATSRFAIPMAKGGMTDGDTLGDFKKRLLELGDKEFVEYKEKQLKKQDLYYAFRDRLKNVHKQTIVIKDDLPFKKGGKIGFDGLAKKVAKKYEGTRVPKEYQEQYGKTYNKKEAMEVGKKVAGKVYRQQQSMEAGGTLPTPFGQAGLVGETGTMNEMELFAMGGGLPQGVHQYYGQTYNPAYPTPHGYAKGGEINPRRQRIIDEIKDIQEEILFISKNPEGEEEYFKNLNVALQDAKKRLGNFYNVPENVMAKGGEIKSVAKAIYEPNEQFGGIETSRGKKTLKGLENMIDENDAYDVYVALESNFEVQPKGSPKIATTYGDKTMKGLIAMIENSKGSYAKGGMIEEWSIQTDDEDEHFDNEEDAREFWESLSNEERKSGQYFRKSYFRNQDGELEEDEVEIIEEYAKGGSIKVGDKVKYPKATMVGKVKSIKDSDFERTLTIEYDDGKIIKEGESSVIKLAKGGFTEKDTVLIQKHPSGFYVVYLFNDKYSDNTDYGTSFMERFETLKEAKSFANKTAKENNASIKMAKGGKTKRSKHSLMQDRRRVSSESWEVAYQKRKAKMEKGGKIGYRE